MRFLEVDEVKQFLLDDTDRYVAGFSVADLRARGIQVSSSSSSSASMYYDTATVDGKDKYRNVAANAVRAFTPQHEEILSKVARIADGLLKNNFSFAQGRALTAYETTLKTICECTAKLPWTFALTSADGAYEAGLPHTRGHIIFLCESIFATSSPHGGRAEAAATSSTTTSSHTSVKNLLRTLVHEKLHVYQRYFPEECLVTLYHMLSFRRHGMRSDFRAHVDDRIRSNPDLDGYVYTRDGHLCFARYTSTSPRSVLDTVQVGPTEHPHEWLAYTLAAMLVV